VLFLLHHITSGFYYLFYVDTYDAFYRTGLLLKVATSVAICPFVYLSACFILILLFGLNIASIKVIRIFTLSKHYIVAGIY
jgi:hypothetical protein